MASPDQLAKEGFIAIAPDFLTGMGPNQGGSAELGEQGSAKEIGKLTDEDKVRKLNAVRAYALTIPAATSRTAAVGFCWGGAASFPVRAASAGVERRRGVLRRHADGRDGLHRRKNARSSVFMPSTTIASTRRSIWQRRNWRRGTWLYEQHFFEGAGHGFLRQQNGNERAPANAKAAERAWALTLEFLRKHTK